VILCKTFGYWPPNGSAKYKFVLSDTFAKEIETTLRNSIASTGNKSGRLTGFDFENIDVVITEKGYRELLPEVEQKIDTLPNHINEIIAEDKTIKAKKIWKKISSTLTEEEQEFFKKFANVSL